MKNKLRDKSGGTQPVTKLRGMLPIPKKPASLEEMDAAIVKGACAIDMAINRGLKDVKAGQLRPFDGNYIEELKTRIKPKTSTHHPPANSAQ